MRRGGRPDHADLDSASGLGADLPGPRLACRAAAAAAVCLASAFAPPPARADAVEVVRGVAYASGADADPARHVMDVYLPAGRADAPVVVFAHGGGWTSGDRRNHANIGQALAARGIGVALVDYRLTDGGPGSVVHPAHARDVARAVAFLRAYLIVRGGVPGGVFLMGQGAGAHLAALVATDARLLAAHGLSPADLRGVVGISGIYRIDPQSREYANVFGTDPLARADASPVAHASRGDPPFLLLYAADDLPRRDAEAEAMAEALRAAGVARVVDGVPGRDFETILSAIGQPGDPTTDRIVDFVGRLVPRATPSATAAGPTPAAPTPVPAAPPSQPADGPGGAARRHAAAAWQAGGAPGAAWWRALPAAPDPAPGAPLVIVVPARGADPRHDYAAWVEHAARGGAAVAVVDAGAAASADRSAAAAASAVAALVADGVAVDGSHAVYAGHAEGAAVAAALAATWFDRRLPAPRGLVALMPRGGAGAVQPGMLARLPRDTRFLLVAADAGPAVDDAADIALWDGTAHLPAAWRNRLVVETDAHGVPPLVADWRLPFTAGPHGAVDALDWYGPWKWLDALTACGYRNADCRYAFGGTPEQTGLGVWADGRPVTPARLAAPRRPVRFDAWLPIAGQGVVRPRR